MYNELSQVAKDLVTYWESVALEWEEDLEGWFTQVEQAMDALEESGTISSEEYMIIEQLLGF